MASGATADVQHGPAGAIEDTLVHRSGPAEPHVDRQRAGAAAVVAQDGLAVAVEDRAEELGGGHATPVSARARAKRPAGARAATARASAMRSTSRSAGSSATRSPS